MYLFNFSLKSFIALYSVQFLSSPDFSEIRSLNKYFRNGYDKWRINHRKLLVVDFVSYIYGSDLNDYYPVSGESFKALPIFFVVKFVTFYPF